MFQQTNKKKHQTKKYNVQRIGSDRNEKESVIIWKQQVEDGKWVQAIRVQAMKKVRCFWNSHKSRNWEWSQWNMDLWNQRMSRLLHLFAHLLVAPAWGNTCPSTWQPLPSRHTHSLALIDLCFCENEQKTRFLTSNIHTDTCVFHFLTL